MILRHLVKAKMIMEIKPEEEEIQISMIDNTCKGQHDHILGPYWNSIKPWRTCFYYSKVIDILLSGSVYLKHDANIEKEAKGCIFTGVEIYSVKDRSNVVNYAHQRATAAIDGACYWRAYQHPVSEFSVCKRWVTLSSLPRLKGEHPCQRLERHG